MDGGEDFSWVPAACRRGHPLGRGKVNYSFRHCTCVNATDGRGHQVAYCRVDGCDSPPALPPGCPGGDR